MLVLMMMMLIIAEVFADDSITKFNKSVPNSTMRTKSVSASASFSTDKISSQSRSIESTSSTRTKSENKPIADMSSIYQQHLIGPNVANAVVEHVKPERKDLWSRFSTNREGTSIESNSNGKKGKLQTVGTVIGDIIGVLVSEIARFFGSIVSDVAREVTAHGFVSLFKQIADLTGFAFQGHGMNRATHHNQPSSIHSPIH